MIYARAKTQWLVVGPPSVEDPSVEGIAPLFKYFILPQYKEEDLFAEDWEKRLLERFLVEVKYREEDKGQKLENVVQTVAQPVARPVAQPIAQPVAQVFRPAPKWHSMPVYTMNPKKPLPYWADRALKDVTHIRILFPIYLSQGLW